eukprot:4555582-Amphidinium_carterae.1
MALPALQDIGLPYIMSRQLSSVRDLLRSAIVNNILVLQGTCKMPASLRDILRLQETTHSGYCAEQNMGSNMAANLQRKGHSLIVYDANQNCPGRCIATMPASIEES